MSGRRTKALRAQFQRLYGRAPEVKYVEVESDSVFKPNNVVCINEFRRFRRGIVRLAKAAA